MNKRRYISWINCLGKRTITCYVGDVRVSSQSMKGLTIVQFVKSKKTTTEKMLLKLNNHVRLVCVMFTFQRIDEKPTKSRDVSVQKKIAMYLGRYTNVEDFDHNSIIFVFMLCSAVAVALGFLTSWHILLILKGETSIELHINKSKRIEYRKLGKVCEITLKTFTRFGAPCKNNVYRNPYDYGPWQNWKILLGIVNNRSWTSIVLPSSHHPYGDGITWKPPPKSYVSIKYRPPLPV
ncbi:hypothetical protein QZH41_019510 [Actinostola sp. cb2023]|nr:hypothetical protein QZH41_019510 [Actinostola sp. cb2023]